MQQQDLSSVILHPVEKQKMTHYTRCTAETDSSVHAGFIGGLVVTYAVLLF
jgi:hypothetical protein